MSVPDRRRSRRPYEGLPPPQRDDIDALVDAVSAGARLVTPTDPARSSTPRVALSRSPSWRWPVAPRMVVVLVAFSAGVAGTVWMLRSLEPRPVHDSSIDTPPLQASPAFAAAIPLVPAVPSSLTAADRDTTEAPAILEPLDTPLPRIEPSARDLPLRADRTVPAGPVTRATERPTAPAATPIEIAPVEPEALAAAPIDAAPAASPPSVARTVVLPPSEVSAESAVRETVADYRRALEQLDVNATAELWPSVDRRMLARAFSSLKAQELSFETCDVMLGDRAATARCQGTAQYVVKVGSAGARVGRFEWLFSMHKQGDSWRIDGVTASALADQQ